MLVIITHKINDTVKDMIIIADKDVTDIHNVILKVQNVHQGVYNLIVVVVDTIIILVPVIYSDLNDIVNHTHLTFTTTDYINFWDITKMDKIVEEDIVQINILKIHIVPYFIQVLNLNNLNILVNFGTH